MSLPNTHFGAEYIGALMAGGAKKIFFAGIGGISMCSLAYISKLRGHTVSGYDRTPSKITRDLEAKGIDVFYENDEAHIEVQVSTVEVVERIYSKPERLKGMLSRNAALREMAQTLQLEME